MSKGFERVLDVCEVAARHGDVGVAISDAQLHSASLGDDLLHLSEIDQKGTVAAHNRGISLQFFFHLFGGGTKRVGMYLSLLQMIHFHIVAHGLDVEKMGKQKGGGLVGRTCEGDGGW